MSLYSGRLQNLIFLIETYFNKLCKSIAESILSNLIQLMQLVSFNQNERDRYVKLVNVELICNL